MAIRRAPQSYPNSIQQHFAKVRPSFDTVMNKFIERKKSTLEYWEDNPGSSFKEEYGKFALFSFSFVFNTFIVRLRKEKLKAHKKHVRNTEAPDASEDDGSLYGFNDDSNEDNDHSKSSTGSTTTSKHRHHHHRNHHKLSHHHHHHHHKHASDSHPSIEIAKSEQKEIKPERKRRPRSHSPNNSSSSSSSSSSLHPPILRRSRHRSLSSDLSSSSISSHSRSSSSSHEQRKGRRHDREADGKYSNEQKTDNKKKTTELHKEQADKEPTG